MSDVPSGFAPHFRKSGLTDPWEPLYSRREAGSVIIALRAAEAHANSRGFVHGGLLTALADNAMGLSCGETMRAETGQKSYSLVTVSMAIDFIGTARIGQWVEVRPKVLRTGGRICFCEALVYADETLCARANATFSVVQ